MSLVHTIGELSDYANNVGGLLRLKRREEEWVSVEEWLNLNKQIKELETENKQLKERNRNQRHTIQLEQDLQQKYKNKIIKALEIINGKDSRLIMDLDLFLRVREVLQK